MKKSFLTIAVLLGLFSIVITSCSEDEDPPTTYSATYSISMDGEEVASGTTEEVGILENLASIGEGDDLSLLIASIPLTVGGVTEFDASNSSGVVTIMGKNLLLTDGSDELYFSTSGSITRESTSKISFEGTCTMLMGTTEHSFSGYIESSAYKIIK